MLRRVSEDWRIQLFDFRLFFANHCMLWCKLSEEMQYLFCDWKCALCGLDRYAI